MNADPWGSTRPPPTTESRFFNAARKSVILLVEAGIDGRFWRQHCTSQCTIRHQGQGGRSGALKELKKAEKYDDAILLAILDADFDRLEGTLEEHQNIIWTDAHDLETTLLGIPQILLRVLGLSIDDDKRTENEARWRESTRARLFRHAEPMGRLRWLKQREGIKHLFFKKESSKKKGDALLFDAYRKNCCDDDWCPSPDKSITALINYSSAHGILNGHDLRTRCNALPEADPRQVCNGHDLIGFLRALIHTHSRNKVSTSELGRQLIGCCERAWVEGTHMWQAILRWQAANPGFQVLKTDAEHGHQPHSC